MFSCTDTGIGDKEENSTKNVANEFQFSWSVYGFLVNVRTVSRNSTGALPLMELNAPSNIVFGGERMAMHAGP